MRRADLAVQVALRVAVFAMVVAVIVAGAAVGPLVVESIEDQGAPPTETLANPEYAPNKTVVDPLAATGTVRPSVDSGDRGGVVLIDNGHGNGIARADIAPLVEALVATGHRVRFHDSGDDLGNQLRAADAFVVIDPANEYGADEIENVKEFTDRGGRLLLVGEPDRIRVAGLFGLTTRSSRLTTLGSAYNVSFDTRYLYNAGANDGNYKHVLAGGTAAAGLQDINRTAMYTATRVRASNGTDLLVTVDGTRLSETTAPGTYAVAVRSGPVMALGDRTFLQSNRYAVADNEEFVAHVVAFLAAGEGGSGVDADDGLGDDVGDAPTTGAAAP